MSRTELWEARKDAPVTGHVGFTVDDDEHVRLPYTMLATILQSAGLRRKINTDHGARLSLRPLDPTAPAPADSRPPPGYRWLSPRECHGSDQFCPQCSPDSPERRVTHASPQ